MQEIHNLLLSPVSVLLFPHPNTVSGSPIDNNCSKRTIHIWKPASFPSSPHASLSTSHVICVINAGIGLCYFQFSTLLRFLLLHFCCWCSHNLDSVSPIKWRLTCLNHPWDSKWTLAVASGMMHHLSSVTQCLILTEVKHYNHYFLLSPSLPLSFFFLLPLDLGFRILRLKGVKQCTYQLRPRSHGW